MLRASKWKMVGWMLEWFGWMVSCNHITDLCCCISTLIRIVSVRALFIKPVRFGFIFFVVPCALCRDFSIFNERVGWGSSLLNLEDKKKYEVEKSLNGFYVKQIRIFEEYQN